MLVRRPAKLLALSATAFACSSSREPPTVIARRTDGETIVRVFSQEDTIRAAGVPTRRMAMPRVLATDSFRNVSGIQALKAELFVLDRWRTPHVSQVDNASGETIHRYVNHVVANRDTISPLAVGLRSNNTRTELLLLDARKKRLVSSLVDVKTGRAALRFYDVRQVLEQSDNPVSLAVSAWGAAFAGTMTQGTQIAYSPDLLHWQIWRDTTPVRLGLPLDSFMRSIATASMVVMHPERHVVILAGEFQRSLALLDLREGTMRRLVIDSADGAPATLRLADDKSVRIRWRPDATRHFVAGASSSSLVALLDCECRSVSDTARERKQIWLFHWDGSPVARLLSPAKVSGLTFSEDGRRLIAAVEERGWQRLIEWPLP